METITLTSTKSQFEYRLPKIKNKTKIALLSFKTNNSIPNIDETNNLFLYEYKGKVYGIVIPTGAYEINSLNLFINNELKKNNHSDIFEIIPNHNTLKCTIKINDSSVKIFFTQPKSIGKLLGFNKDISEEINEGLNTVEILKISNIFIKCNLIESSFLNGTKDCVLYNFFPNVPPGYVLNENPIHIVHHQLNTTEIDKIAIRITDQNDDLVNFRGEEIIITLLLQ